MRSGDPLAGIVQHRFQRLLHCPFISQERNFPLAELNYCCYSVGGAVQARADTLVHDSNRLVCMPIKYDLWFSCNPT